DSKPEILKSKIYCSICKSSVALDIIIDDGKRILVWKEDLKEMIYDLETIDLFKRMKERYKIDD
ncbi:hypothetical protein LCGC14_1963930, partial [marine sediment metagenome]